MSSWIETVERADVEDGKHYFVAMRPRSDLHQTYHFWGRGLNGKALWTLKPGIAIRFVGGDQLRDLLDKREDCVAVKVPADADTRWRARKPPTRYR